MPTDDQQNVFGEYAPKPSTAAIRTAPEPSPPGEIESIKYGIGKPRRIIVRGKVAADSGTEDQRE